MKLLHKLQIGPAHGSLPRAHFVVPKSLGAHSLPDTLFTLQLVVLLPLSQARDMSVPVLAQGLAVRHLAICLQLLC